MRFDCDPPLPFKVHRIKKLVLSLAVLDRTCAFQQPVGQRRFPVIDVRDDAKIPRQLNSHGSATIQALLRVVNFADYPERFLVQLHSLRGVLSLSVGRFSPFFPHSTRFLDGGAGRGEEPSGADGPPHDSDPFGVASVKKIRLICQTYSPNLGSRVRKNTVRFFVCPRQSPLDRYAVTCRS